MQKFSLYCAPVLLVLLAAALNGCKKVNGINNRQVIETPYSVYFSDTAGALFNTTDGINIRKVSDPDGYPCRAICVSGTNVLWAKSNLYLMMENEKNFNHTYDSLRSVADVGCNGLGIDLNQSMILDVPDWNKVYTMTNADPGDDIRPNLLGLVHSDNHGYRGTWIIDTVYNYDSVGTLPVEMTSVTQLKDGTVCGLAYDADGIHVRNFYKTCKDESFACSWAENTGNPDGIPSVFQYNLTGLPLPPYGIYTNASYFYLGHFNNRLIAVDGKCSYGGWYSDDKGRNWKQFDGLPVNVPLLCVASPFEQTCLVGTDSAGLYMLNLNTNRFELNTNGLDKYLKVRSITWKENIFKNGNKQQYVYIATDRGLYQSTDGGHNWIKTILGNYIAIY